jgi:hypothetical protein
VGARVGSAVVVGAVVEGFGEDGAVVVGIDDGAMTGESVGSEVSIASGGEVVVVFAEASRVGAIVRLVLSSPIDGDSVLSSVIDGELVLSPVSDGDGVGKGSAVAIDKAGVGIAVSVGESVDESAISVVRPGVGISEVSAGAGEGISSGSPDSSSAVDSVSVVSVEFVGRPPAYCSQYGQCPSARHSANDSDIPEHPSKEEISVIPSKDAAWQYLLRRILIALACHLRKRAKRK